MTRGRPIRSSTRWTIVNNTLESIGLKYNTSGWKATQRRTISSISQGTPRLRATPCLACSNCGESPLRHTWRKDLSGQPSRKVFFSCPVAETWPSGVLSTISSRSEEHTSELQSLMRISYAVFCLKKKNTTMHKANNESTSNSKQHNITDTC